MLRVAAARATYGKEEAGVGAVVYGGWRPDTNSPSPMMVTMPGHVLRRAIFSGGTNFPRRPLLRSAAVDYCFAQLTYDFLAAVKVRRTQVNLRLVLINTPVAAAVDPAVEDSCRE